MPERAHFSSKELEKVLMHYDIGQVRQLKPLSAGRREPKVVIISEQGKFLLKRLPKTKTIIERVAFAHAVQTHLAQMAFPVTSVVTGRDRRTILQLGDHIYACLRFVAGGRYDGSAEATADSGRQLANLHGHLADFACEYQPPTGSFHGSSSVRVQLEKTAQKTPTPNSELQETAEALAGLYQNCSHRVNQLGFESWPQQIVHGDWHPGNMLFAEGKLVAVLDFDSIRLAPMVTDLANGMLQFSKVAGSPNPADWPDYLDQAKLVQFSSGYRQVIEPERNELSSLGFLMTEAMIAEAIMFIATAGAFDYSAAVDVLKMVRRKAEWIEKNRNKLTEAMRL